MRLRATRLLVIINNDDQGGAPWTPADLGADLALWLDADDASTITLNGTNVSQWDDKSGNNRHATQGTAADQPTYSATGLNGKPSLLFDGTNDVMLGVSAQTGFFITVLAPGLTSYGAPIGFTTKHGLIRDGLTDSLYFSPQSLFLSSSARRNGVLSIQMGTATAIFSQGGTAFSVPIQLGDDTTGGSFTDCNIAEVAVLSSNPSDANRQKLEGYLAWKWGLTYALPSGHPYKWDTSLFGGTNQDGFDADAKTYITAVETSDGQDLEPGVREAINDFVVGCKADGIWNAIKASAILAGARTLTGALVPLKGTAPTNFNFISGDYNRTTGLVGDGSTKYLNSNRNNNADPQDSKHLALYQSSLATADSLLFATSNVSGRSALISFLATGITQRMNSNAVASTNGNSVGFVGAVRTTSTATAARVGGADFPDTITSQVPSNENIGVFATASGAAPTNARLAFYSVGESLDLALLDTRVTALINAYGAIP